MRLIVKRTFFMRIPTQQLKSPCFALNAHFHRCTFTATSQTPSRLFWPQEESRGEIRQVRRKLNSPTKSSCSVSPHLRTSADNHHQRSLRRSRFFPWQLDPQLEPLLELVLGRVCPIEFGGQPWLSSSRGPTLGNSHHNQQRANLDWFNVILAIVMRSCKAASRKGEVEGRERGSSFWGPEKILAADLILCRCCLSNKQKTNKKHFYC